MQGVVFKLSSFLSQDAPKMLKDLVWIFSMERSREKKVGICNENEKNTKGVNLEEYMVEYATILARGHRYLTFSVVRLFYHYRRIENFSGPNVPPHVSSQLVHVQYVLRVLLVLVLLRGEAGVIQTVFCVCVA